MSNRSWGTNIFWGAVGLTTVFTLIVPSCSEALKDTALNDGKPNETNVQQFNRKGVEKLIDNSSSAIEGITDKIGDTIESTTEEDVIEAREKLIDKASKVGELAKTFIFGKSNHDVGDDYATQTHPKDCPEDYFERQRDPDCF